MINIDGKGGCKMKRMKIDTDEAPKAIGPYSQGIAVNGIVFTSGQIPVTLNGDIPEGIEAQAKQALRNLGSVLKSAGADYGDVVKTTVFIKDMNDFAKFNEIYASFFNEPYPARSCVEVSRLPKDVLIEIEAVAVRR